MSPRADCDGPFLPVANRRWGDTRGRPTGSRLSDVSLNDEADCVALQHENRVGFLSLITNVGRSRLPRERFRSSAIKRQSPPMLGRLLFG